MFGYDGLHPAPVPSRVAAVPCVAPHRKRVRAEVARAGGGTIPADEKMKGIARTRHDSPSPTAAQLARKARSGVVIKDLGLPWLESLPVVEDEAQITPRTKAEVIGRTVATTLCAVKGESGDQKLAQELLDKYAARALLSPAERAFMGAASPSKEELANFSWRYECVHVFLWALGYLPRVAAPDTIADVKTETGFVAKEGAAFGKEATLRPLAEILDQNDLYYRLHWAAIELRVAGKTHPRANEEIIDERHRALNWLIRYMNQEWDDVTTDT